VPDGYTSEAMEVFVPRTIAGGGEATVRTDVGHVFAKTGARDRAQAVVFAYESGHVRPGEVPPAG